MSWGPWIEHDGTRPWLPRHAVQVMVTWSHESGEMWVPAAGGISRCHPAWFWRWRVQRRGLLRRKRLVRVCDDPRWRPIIRYRLWYPDALEELKRIAAAPGPVDAPREVA